VLGYYHATDLRRERYKMTASVSLSVSHVPEPNSKIERPRKPKIGRMYARYTGSL